MLLSLFCAGLITSAGAATAPPTAKPDTVVVHELVPKPGRYRVTVTLADRSGLDDVVRLRIGSVKRRVVLGRHASRLSIVLRVPGRTLTVQAAGRRARPRVTISMGLVGPVTPTRVPIGDPGSWKLVCDDEVNGSHLNTRHWSTGWFGSGITGPLGPGALECFDPAQVTVGGGELDVSMIAKSESCSGATHPYASGIVTTNGKFDFAYGLAEVRAWVPGSGGVIADWPRRAGDGLLL